METQYIDREINRLLDDKEVETLAYDFGLLKIEQVLKLVAVSRVTWYRRIKAGIAPKPVRQGDNSTAWFVKDIREYCLNLPKNDE